MHKLYCITANKQYDITPLTGSLSWRSSLDQLGVQLDFEIAFNDDRYFPVNPIDLGSLVILVNQNEIFQGIVVKENRNGRGTIQYNCFDYAFYLNKSKGIYQFSKMQADSAIKKILADFAVPIGKITGIPIPITKIYPGDLLSDMIKDILVQAQNATGIKYRMEMSSAGLCIEPQQDMIIRPVFQLAANIAPAPVTSAINSPSRSRSIEEMKNSIKITSGNDKAAKVVAEVKNPALIKQYGLLQEVQSIEGKNQAQAKQIAGNLLKELGKIFEDNSLELPGNDEVRAGRILELNEPITGMLGKYLIQDVTHNVKSGIHTMQLNLGVL